MNTNSTTKDLAYRERVRLLLAQGLGTRQIAKDTCRRHCYVGRIRDELLAASKATMELAAEARKAEELTKEAA